MHLTNGQGADVVILTPGEMNGDLLAEALDITGKGATCVVTGLGFRGASEVRIDLGELTLFNKQIRGCLFGFTGSTRVDTAIARPVPAGPTRP